MMKKRICSIVLVFVLLFSVSASALELSAGGACSMDFDTGEVYYSKNDKSSKIMAQTIQNNAILFLQPENNRKPKEATSAIYLLDRLERPAVLIECGFLSNAEDLALLTQAEYRQKLSLIFAESIAQYLLDESTSS